MLTIQQLRLKDLYFRGWVISDEALPKMIELENIDRVAKAIKNAKDKLLITDTEYLSNIK